jgi:Helix-turn-helix domain
MVEVLAMRKPSPTPTKPDATAGRVECENDLLGAGFIQTPIVVLRDHDLSAGAKLVYGALLWYLWRGGTYPGQVEMAGEFGMSERSVRTYLGELQNRGYLTSKRHGLGQPNTYTILCPWDRRTDRQNLPVKAAKPAGQGGKSRRSILIDSDSKESISKPVDPKANRRTSRLAFAQAALAKGRTVEEVVAELVQKTKTPQDEAERIVAEVQATEQGRV